VHLLVEASGPASIGAFFGFEGVKAPLPVPAEPTLQGGDPDPPSAIVGEVMLELCLLAEVFILGPFGFGQNGADDLIAFQGDFLSDLLFYKLSSW
jgi:hypothetical protein